jgi:integrase
LRSGEVARLRRQDLDWDREIISIMRPKPRRTQQYPVVSEAGGWARREIFLTLKPPFRHLSQDALYHLVN